MGRFEHLELGDWLQQPEEVPESGIIDQDYYLRKANDAFADENYERAMAFYSRALQYNLDLEDAWLGQLRCLIELRELQEATIWSNRALGRFPNGALILAARAVADSRAGKTVSAMGYSDGGFSAQGGTPYAWVARGETLISINPANAKACFAKAIELAPSDWQIRSWIARAYIVRGKYHQALAYLREAVKLDPERFVCWYWIGRCSESMGDTGGAIQSYGRAVGAEPRFTRARDALTRLRNRSSLVRLGSAFKRVFSIRRPYEV